MKAYEFANKVKTLFEQELSALTVFLSDVVYRSAFGSKVLPMKVYGYSSGSKTPVAVGFNQLIELFGKVPYIMTNKNPVKGIYMTMRISLVEKEYEGHKYYDTYLHGVRDEKLKPKLDSLKDKVYARIREFRETDKETSLFDDLEEL